MTTPVTSMPAAFAPGVKFLEDIGGQPEVETWLRQAIAGDSRHLAAGRDDWPVQAIVNHVRYVTAVTRQRIHEALESLTRSCLFGDGGNEDEARYLFELVVALAAENATLPIISVANESAKMRRLPNATRHRLVATLAHFPAPPVPQFWKKLARGWPEYSATCFEVLGRISPEEAIALIKTLPPDEHVLRSFAPRLLRFLRRSPEDIVDQRTESVCLMLSGAPSEVSEMLGKVLVSGGFWASGKIRVSSIRFVHVLQHLDRAPSRELEPREALAAVCHEAFE